DQAQHINFARAQLILGSVLSQLRRDFGRYSLVSSMDTPDRVQQFSAYVSLQDVSPSTRFDGAQDLNIPGIGRQYDDLGVREFVSDPVDGFGAIHIGHLNIHQSDIRPVPSKLLDGLLAVGRLGYQLHVWFSLNQGRDSLAQKGMVIHGEDPNHTTIGA